MTLAFDEIVAMLGPRANPDAKWVAEVAGCGVEEAERAVSGIASCRGEVSELCRSISATGRSYYAQFPAPIELYAFVKLTRPLTLVESGVSSGVSTTFMLLGIEENGLGGLHSIDLPVHRKEKRGNESWAIPRGLDSGWAIPSALRRNWDLRVGRSERLLDPLLLEGGPVDIYCHESPVDSRHLAYEMRKLKAHLKPGSLVVADNTGENWKAFSDVAMSHGATPIRRKKSQVAAFRVPAR